MKHATLVVLCFLAGSAIAQTARINVSRPLYAYEVLDAVPAGMTSEDDRAAVTQFLSDKKRAGSAHFIVAQNACPAFMQGRMSAMQFAVHMDSEVDKMTRAFASAYDRMVEQLSMDGLSIVRATIARANVRDAADTRAVDIVALAPGTAELSFREMCASE